MTPRNEQENEKIKSERKEEILEAALKLFAKNGFSATKISEIAAVAGLSHGLVYHYFDSKEDIFVQLLEESLTTSIGVFQMFAAGSNSPREKLTDIIESIIPLAYQGIGSYYFLIVLEAYKSESVPDKVKELVAEMGPKYREYLLPIIEEGQKKNQIIAGDPKEIVTSFLSLLHGLAVMTLQDDEVNIPEPEIILQMFLC